MSLEKLRKELEKLENGSTYLAMLDTGLESVYSELNSGKAFIKTAKKILGENEAEYQDKASKIADYDKLEAKYTLLETQYTNLENENKTIKRDSALTELCNKEEVNKDALGVLLPSNLELTDKGVKITEEGKETKEMTLKEFINSDPNLKIFSDSLFKKGEKSKGTPPAPNTPPVISTETGDNAPPKGVADAALSMVSERKKDRETRVASRFNLDKV